jgi:hypothetical protein
VERFTGRNGPIAATDRQPRIRRRGKQGYKFIKVTLFGQFQKRTSRRGLWIIPMMMLEKRKRRQAIGTELIGELLLLL